MKENSSLAGTGRFNKSKKRGFVLDALIKGILVLIPIMVILIILNWIFNFIMDIISPMSNLFDPGQDESHWFAKVISLIILLVIIFGIGLVIKNKKGREQFRIFEAKYLQQIPLYGAILETVNQFTGLKEMPFKKVVLIDPFDTGAVMTGFVTDSTDDDMFTVFVPTAPNPANGFIYHVKKNQITFLDANPEQVMRSIIAMGTGTSRFISSEKLRKSTDSTAE